MRLIDVDAYCETYCRWYRDGECNNGFACAMQLAPTIEAEPVKHGRWMERQIQGRYGSNTYYECSVCCQIADEYKSPYCRHCGAKMDGGNDDH